MTRGTNQTEVTRLQTWTNQTEVISVTNRNRSQSQQGTSGKSKTVLLTRNRRSNNSNIDINNNNDLTPDGSGPIRTIGHKCATWPPAAPSGGGPLPDHDILI